MQQFQDLVFNKDYKKKLKFPYNVQRWFRDFWRHRIKDIPGDIYYWVRTHTVHRYHIVDMRDKSNEYSWGWIDRDRAIMFACFALLKQFVEKELTASYEYGPRILERGWRPHPTKDIETMHWNKAHRTMKELYDWWVFERPEKIKEMDDMSVNNEWAEADSLFNETDNTQLRRLIEIKDYLWT